MISLRRSLRITLLSLFACLMFIGCEMHRENLPEDRKKAEEIGQSFYADVLDGKQADLAKQFNESSMQEKVIRVFTKIDSVVGKLKECEITATQSDVTVKNGVQSGQYIINTRCEYERGITDEQLVVTLTQDGWVYSGYNATIEL